MYLTPHMQRKSTIQYNLNGCISVPCTAVQVYSRLGLTADTQRQKRFLKTRKSSNTKAVEELHPDTRSRLTQAITPVLQTVCTAFAGEKHWRQCLYYACNNVEYHSRNSDSTHIQSVPWKDIVHLGVLKNSKLMQGTVTRFNMLYPSNDRKARRSRRRILSEISLDLTLEFINALGFKLPLLPRHKQLLPGTEVC